MNARVFSGILTILAIINLAVPFHLYPNPPCEFCVFPSLHRAIFILIAGWLLLGAYGYFRHPQPSKPGYILIISGMTITLTIPLIAVRGTVVGLIAFIVALYAVTQLNLVE